MPHVVVEGPARLGQFADSFSPLEEVSPDQRIKIPEIFLNTRKTSALLPCVVVEEGVVHRFFLNLLQKENAVTVRLEPLTDPEKTPGVRRAVAMLAERVRSLSPQCRFARTTVADCLRDEATSGEQQKPEDHGQCH